MAKWLHWLGFSIFNSEEIAGWHGGERNGSQRIIVLTHGNLEKTFHPWKYGGVGYWYLQLAKPGRRTVQLWRPEILDGNCHGAAHF